MPDVAPPSNKRKLYLIACCFPPFGRGNSVTNACVANHLASTFDVEVICMLREDGLLLSYQEDNSLERQLHPELTVHRVRSANWLGLNELLYAVGVLPCYFLNWAWAVLRHSPPLASEPTVVLAVYPVFSDLVVGWFLKRRHGHKLIVDLRDDFSGAMSRGWRRLARGLYRWFEARLLHGADWVTVTTDFLRDDLLQRHESLSEKTTVVYNVVPPAGRDFEPPAGDVVRIAYAGAISSIQKPEMLLLAQSRLGQLRPELDERVHVDLYGPESPYFRMKVSNLVKGRAEFHGFLPREELLEALGRTDIGFLSLADSTYAYATPTKLFECLEFGIPMLAALPQGAARSLIEELDVGLVSDPDDIEGLAQHMARLVEDAALRMRFRRNCLRARSRFSPEEQVGKWRDIVLSLHASSAVEEDPPQISSSLVER